MANISDTIEQFILSVIGDDETIKLSRNELANYFKVAPSQINYVLSTRFNYDRGYVIESKRGGGGFVTLVRLNIGEDNLIASVINELDEIDFLTYNKACDIIDRLARDNYINEAETAIIKSAISDRALAIPMMSESLRKNVFKEILVGIMRR